MTIQTTTNRVLSVFLGLAGACFLFGMGVTVVDVMLRAVADVNVPAAIELTSLSIGLGALLSMPTCYAKRTHVTAKLLSEMAPGRFKFVLGLVGAIVSLFFAGLLFWIASENALAKANSPETTSDLGIPISYASLVVAISLAIGLIAATLGLLSAFRRAGAA